MRSLYTLRNGIYVFSYRPIERWERKLLIDNAYYGTNHALATANPQIVRVDRRMQNTIYTSKPFHGKAVKMWYTYEYITELNQVYPRESSWMNIEAPNQLTFTNYLPNIIASGDTLLFEPQETKTPQHLN
jgi:hypothetical protein